jgi:hypothetical protein
MILGNTSRKGWSAGCRPPYASEPSQIRLVSSCQFDTGSFINLHLAAAADIEAPMLNLIPICRAAAAGQSVPSDDMQTSIMSDRRARDKLVKE